MRCETFLRRLDELDSGRGPGLAMALHASRCPSCAARAAALAAALEACRADADDERGSAVEERVMAAVRLLPPPRQDFAIRDWVSAGVVIAASTLLLPIGESSGFLRTFFGPGYALSFAIVLGISLTIYTAFFIATHMDELEIYLEKLGLRVR